MNESTRIFGLIIIVIGIAIIWYAARRSRGTQGYSSDSGAGSDDGGALLDVIVAPIESNIDYCPPCDPQSESVPPIP